MSSFLKRIRKKLSIGGPQVDEMLEELNSGEIEQQEKGSSSSLSQAHSFHGSWDIFISHKQANGGPQCLALQTKLQLKYGLRVWLDVTRDNISKDAMIHGVRESDHFVIFATDGIFERPYCQMEIKEAKRLNKHIAVIWERDPRHGGKLQVSELLDQVPPGLSFLKDISWIEYNPQERFMRAAIETLLGQCQLPIPDERSGQLFDLDFDPKLTPRQLQREYMKGTRKWIIDAIVDWYQGRASGKVRNQVFMLLGLAGVGKSVLMAEICRRGNADVFGMVPGEFDPSKSGVPIAAYHFFKHDNKRLSSVRKCLVSISAQLRASIPKFREALESQKSMTEELLENADLAELFRRLIAEPALEMSSTTSPVVVLIDAVDECSESAALASLIENEWRAPSVPSWLMLLVSSRPDVFTQSTGSASRLNLGVTVLDTEDQRNLEDVEAFVRHALAGRLAPGTEDLVVQEIVDRSQGLFLYFRFLPDMLVEAEARAPGKRHVSVEDLSGFPAGLSGVYAKFFGRLHAALGASDYLKLLAPVVAAREPLPKVVWMRCFGLDVSGGGDVDEEEDLDAFYPVERHCNNLLYVPEALSGGGTVRFVHKSMREWIAGGSRAPGSNAFKTARHLHVREQLGHEALAVRCCLPIFLNREEVAFAPDAAAFAARQLFFHLCKIGDLVEAFPLLFDLGLLGRRLALDTPNNIANDAEALLLRSQSRKVAPVMKRARPQVQVVVKLLRLAFEALERDPRELPGQVLARLPDAPDLPAELRRLRQDAERSRPGAPWWRPLGPYLETALPSPALRIIRGHHGSVNAVALSPDGATAATACTDKAVRLFDLASGQSLLGPLSGHTAPVNAVAVSRDGRWVASAGRDGLIMVRDAQTGESRYPKEEGRDRGIKCRSTRNILAVAFSPDGARVAAGGDGSQVLLWDLETRERVPLARMEHGQVVSGLAFSPDGTRLASVGFDRALRLWDLAGGGEELWSVRNNAYFFAVAFSPDGATVATGDEKNLVRLFDAAAGRPLQEEEDRPATLAGHTNAVISLAFAPDGAHLLSGARDRTIRVWDLRTRRPVNDSAAVLRGHNGHVTGLAVTPDGRRLVSASLDQTIRVWDLRAQTPDEVAHAHSTHSGSIRAAAFTCDRSVLVTASYDRTIRQWDTETAAAIREPIAVPDGLVTSIACHPHRPSTMASVGKDGLMRVWELETGECVSTSQVGISSLAAVAFSNDGKMVACGGKVFLEDQVKVYDFETMEPLYETIHLIGLRGIVFSPNDEYIGTFGNKSDKYCKVTNVKTGERVLNVNWRGAGEAIAVSFSADSSKFFFHMTQGESFAFDIHSKAMIPDITRQAALYETLLHPNQSAPLVNYANNVVQTLDRHGVGFTLDGGQGFRVNSRMVKTPSGRLIAYVGQWSQVYILTCEEEEVSSTS